MNAKTETKQLRSFGLLVGGIFVAIGAWPVVSGQPVRGWALGLGGLLMGLGALTPRSLALPYKGWMAIGHVLGWVNTRIILGIVFYGLLTPLGLIRRALGHDPLRIAFEPQQDTYRVPKPSRPATHLKNQF
ncbi:MAG: SxtJ family membrane protein [Nitrospira sp.]|nr:SxtJ family membrane protein [Nitrospira sp.]